MKIRDGFVSNSSSTNYTILGAYIDKTKLIPIDSDSPNDGKFVEQDDLDELHKMLETLDLGWAYYDADYDDNYIIGIEPSQFDPNMTINQCKQEVIDKIHQLLPDEELELKDIVFEGGDFDIN